MGQFLYLSSLMDHPGDQIIDKGAIGALALRVKLVTEHIHTPGRKGPRIIEALYPNGEQVVPSHCGELRLPVVRVGYACSVHVSSTKDASLGVLEVRHTEPDAIVNHVVLDPLGNKGDVPEVGELEHVRGYLLKSVLEVNQGGACRVEGEPEISRGFPEEIRGVVIAHKKDVLSFVVELLDVKFRGLGEFYKTGAHEDEIVIDVGAVSDQLNLALGDEILVHVLNCKLGVRVFQIFEESGMRGVEHHVVNQYQGAGLYWGAGGQFCILYTR